MNIYIGNLPHSLSEEALRTLFEQYGNVLSVKIIKDKFTGSSRGFAFVEMSSTEEGEQAIAGLNGKEVEGRRLSVNQALKREEGQGGHGGPRPSRPRSRF